MGEEYLYVLPYLVSWHLKGAVNLISVLAITTRLVDTTTTPMLMKLVLSGKIDPEKLITHSKWNSSAQ